MKIQHKILLLLIGATSVSVLVMMFIASLILREALVKGAQEELAAVLESRYNAVNRQLVLTHHSLRELAVRPATSDALTELSLAYKNLGDAAQSLLQQHFVNKSSVVQLDSLKDYLQAYQRTQQHLPTDDQVWANLLLLDAHGNLVYSSKPYLDFGTNLLQGPWREQGLARAVTPLYKQAVAGVASFADFSVYVPANNQVDAFLAMPVFDTRGGGLLGVVAIELPKQAFQKLLADRVDQGETEISFLVDSSGHLLSASSSRLKSEFEQELRSDVIGMVLKGRAGQGEFVDHRGGEVFSTFRPLQPFKDLPVLLKPQAWGVVAQIDQAEVLQEFKTQLWLMTLVTLILLTMAVVVALISARTISGPMLKLRDALSRLSQREAVEVPGLGRCDEIGEMAMAAEVFRKMTLQVEQDHWMAGHLANLTAAVSAESRMEPAASELLRLLCEQLSIPVASVYLWSGEKYLRVASHGLARRSQVEDAFAMGEGLVGQCARDRQSLVLSPVPFGLGIISSGLAEFPPHELVLYPFIHKKTVLAVLELACHHALTPLQHELLKSASATLGLYLANLQASEHNLFLLEETRLQSLELSNQKQALEQNNLELKQLAEEVRSQSEEVKAQNEELKASQEELRAQQEEMQQKNRLLEQQSEQLRQTNEEASLRSQELQRANQYKSEFLANMSHELRTPLNSLLILSRSLMENESGNLTDEQIESATVISESGTQLLTLINDILDLSKIEAGKLELNRERFSISDLLAYLQRVFSPLLEKKQLQLEFELNVPDQIETDRQRLTQILSNLLSNAIKFTDVGKIVLRVYAEQQDLVFEVEDSGIGIPAEKLEHIFGAFQQLDGSISRKYGGSGLGLAIARRLVQLLGGDVEVFSQLGQGSRFVVRLFGQKQEDIKDLAKPVEVPPPSGSVNVAPFLVVEDDRQLLNIMCRMIHSLGYSTHGVSNAEQALSWLARHKPAGLLLDLGLPRMSGMALLEQLRQSEATRDIPAYIMSGNKDTGQAQLLGALGFLKKPVTRDMLARAIQEMLGQLAPAKRVLLVDQQSPDISQLQQYLLNEPLALAVASNGEAALALLKQQQFDAVLLDLQLPDMDWHCWCRQAAELAVLPPMVVYAPFELSEADVFLLKGLAESIVTKAGLESRLSEELMRAVQISPVTQASKSVAGKKLLVVDDDARNLFALSKVLRSKGYVVESVADSTAALSLLQQQSFDAVLTDIMMPQIDGYQLIRQIRELGYQDLPIYAITAKSMQGDEELCLQAGATAYLSKPVDMKKLLAWLAKL